MQLTHIILFNLLFPPLLVFLFIKVFKIEVENRVGQPLSKSIVSKLLFIAFIMCVFLSIPFYFIEQNFQKNELSCAHKGGAYSRKHDSCVIKDVHDQYLASKIPLD